jgi:hypothetical protein
LIDRGLQASFKTETSLSALWIEITPEYVEVSDFGTEVLLLFPSAYLHEAEFLDMTSLKIRH